MQAVERRMLAGRGRHGSGPGIGVAMPGAILVLMLVLVLMMGRQGCCGIPHAMACGERLGKARHERRRQHREAGDPCDELSASALASHAKNSSMHLLRRARLKCFPA